jgi:hypothetical protein
MIRREPKGVIEYKEIGIFNKKRRYRFRVGKSHTDFYMEESQYQALKLKQLIQPVILMNENGGKKKWWMFKGEFWWENDGYSSDEMKILIIDKLGQKKRQLSKAIARVSQENSSSRVGRQSIPDDVKSFVWQRDGGRCVKCGSQENLEFDHIIPVVKGGSNTARNLQLLCEKCNRSKGPNLF